MTANDTVEGASLNKGVNEGLTEELAFKPRPEGQDSSHMKSGEHSKERERARIVNELPIF